MFTIICVKLGTVRRRKNQKNNVIRNTIIFCVNVVSSYKKHTTVPASKTGTVFHRSPTNFKSNCESLRIDKHNRIAPTTRYIHAEPSAKEFCDLFRESKIHKKNNNK